MKRLAILAALALAACGPKPLTPAQSAALEPADTRLAGLYDGSCKACHTVADSKAPLAGDRSAWDARWKQGLPVLVDHAIQGKGAMPAGGQCAACTPDDFQALITFMAGREESAKKPG